MIQFMLNEMGLHCFLLVVFILTLGTIADLNFCYKELSLNKESNNSDHCLYGLLFENPMIIGAMEPDLLNPESTFCYRKDICVRDEWHCSNRLQYGEYIEAQLIVPNRGIYVNKKWIEGNAIINPNVPICEPFSINDEIIAENVDKDDNFLDSIGKHRKKRQVPPDPATSVKEKTSLKNTIDPKVQANIDEQTKRMFYVITGVNVEDVSSHLRLTKLFHNSVRLVHMICDPLFLKQEFLDNAEQGFLYLLKQQGLERLVDVDVDDFYMLQRALDFCMGDPTASVFIEGNHCPAKFNIESVKRKDVQLPFNRNDEANFVWGKQDIVVDAAWHIIDIVHGMCFATFKENLNLHHKYQVVMEQLFHDALYSRWNGVTKFERVDRVDNVFGSVNTSMQVLDACSQGAYIGSPFLHRLQRPEANNGSRRKRSLKQEILQDANKGATYCLQSQEELIDKTREIWEKQCSNAINE